MFRTAGKAGQLSQRESEQGVERLQPGGGQSPNKSARERSPDWTQEAELRQEAPQSRGRRKERGR